MLSGETIGDDYFALDTSRLRMFGGTSGHWTGMCRTLDKEDLIIRRNGQLERKS